MGLISIQLHFSIMFGQYLSRPTVTDTNIQPPYKVFPDIRMFNAIFVYLGITTMKVLSKRGYNEVCAIIVFLTK